MHGINKVLCLHLFLIGCLNFISAQSVISTQEQFDELITRINQGESVDVRLKKGTYILSKPINATNNVRLKGKKANIIGANNHYNINDTISSTGTHYIYKKVSEIAPFSLFVDDADNIIPVSECVDPVTKVNITADSIVGKYESKNGINIKIPIADNLEYLGNKTFYHTYGYFDCGWSRICININHSDNQYFYCTTLDNTNVPDFNYDKKIYRKDIRYVIYNADMHDDGIYYDNENIYIPKKWKYVACINNDNFSSSNPSMKFSTDVTLEGITFKNFNGILINSKENNICNLTGCIFLNTLGSTLSLNKNNSDIAITAHIKDCDFSNCSMLNGSIINLWTEKSQHNCITVENCILDRYKDYLCYYKNTSSTLAVRGDITIKNSTIKNTSRDQMFLHDGQIYVTGNTLYNTSEFRSQKERNLSNDWGIIYCNHLFRDNENAIANKGNTILIENNLLYGAWANANDARGIMIDDGRGDVTCRNNIILDTQMYSLDSRTVNNFIGTASIRNVFEGNIVDNAYRLQCGNAVPEKDIPISNHNICIGELKNKISGTKLDSKDIVISNDESITTIDGKVHCSKELFKNLNKHTILDKNFFCSY